MTTLFPSILPNGEEFVDDSYSLEELQRMEWSELRKVASEHPSEEVNGKSDKEAIIEALTGAKRV